MENAYFRVVDWSWILTWYLLGEFWYDIFWTWCSFRFYFSIYLHYQLFKLLTTVADLKRLEVHARDGPSDPNALAKWRILNRLHDRNETMYYKVSTITIMFTHNRSWEISAGNFLIHSNSNILWQHIILSLAALQNMRYKIQRTFLITTGLSFSCWLYNL